MATLVAKNGEFNAGRLELRPGINTVGRAEGNDHVIPHRSISSRHCELIVNGGSIAIRDLGSTNGTFIEGKQVERGGLFHGQHVKLGAVEFVVDAPECLSSPADSLRVRAPAAAVPAEGAPPAAALTARDAIAAINPAALAPQSFYRLLPGAFLYPFKGSGLFLLGLGTVFFLVLGFMARFALVFRFVIRVFTLGYLFAYMQRIISSSALGEDEVPDFPDVTEIWSDILLPFLFYMGTVIVSFAPVIAVELLLQGHPLRVPIGFGALIFSGCYAPMALLAVAVSDNFFGLSPHIVLPSIVRVAVPYLVVCVILGALVGVTWAVSFGLSWLRIPIVSVVVEGFVSLYFLVVGMRILGLLFRCYRDRLGWV